MPRNTTRFLPVASVAAAAEQASWRHECRLDAVPCGGRVRLRRQLTAHRHRLKFLLIAFIIIAAAPRWQRSAMTPALAVAWQSELEGVRPALPNLHL